ncbi:putative alanine-glyoxylate transaminase [Emiliania huxleyi CCMP1516]|uniref:Uncharacterized protein n=2 Tax=Emiliania huxleyi TaxID=2903 RepID=A0A0D3JJ51_EMIH1|nr:putative alanine-glyoxylate transaminase [Emiliania huxleyi CCMP1516]EOD23536.1 putative alanine-glyoxylate transaminase [Emiliania huxleyi CCMP1516]|eukprot:XP_005775965.1 putative alanine-glyoxylate transaminase [Emiliania huxleyi CCMP1516]
MPAPLRDGVVFFVNSGSEANDLALRLARAANTRGASRCLVVEHAYHGHTSAVIGLSPYKFDHRSFGGRGQPEWVTKCPAPDLFRGPHRGADAGRRYAEAVAEACGEEGEGGVCAFFIESGMSVAGVLLPPAGYLASCYEAVRAAGGVCVADEGVAPDIVTMGKPMGNGMPLAAVVATRRVSDAFAAGPEYFNTFGGNPVCAAAGLAVLEAIERDGLRANAAATGQWLRAALQALRAEEASHGVEFVRERASREPAAAETSWLCSRLKDEHRILTSIDGPHDNVLVIKPPLCFSRSDAEQLVHALRSELVGMRGADLAGVTATPT